MISQGYRKKLMAAAYATLSVVTKANQAEASEAGHGTGQAQIHLYKPYGNLLCVEIHTLIFVQHNPAKTVVIVNGKQGSFSGHQMPVQTTQSHTFMQNTRNKNKNPKRLSQCSLPLSNRWHHSIELLPQNTWPGVRVSGADPVGEHRLMQPMPSPAVLWF